MIDRQRQWPTGLQPENPGDDDRHKADRNPEQHKAHLSLLFARLLPIRMAQLMSRIDFSIGKGPGRAAMGDGVQGADDLFEIIAHDAVDASAEAGPGAGGADPKILEAGVSAPSGGNMQRWRFLVISDPEVKQTVGAYYKRAWEEVVGPRYRAGEAGPWNQPRAVSRACSMRPNISPSTFMKPRCGSSPACEGATPTRTSGSSIYPAVQNMLLAARALGLGATLTTLYLNFEKEVEAALGLPADCALAMRCCRSAIRSAASARFAASRSPISSMRISGAGPAPTFNPLA